MIHFHHIEDFVEIGIACKEESTPTSRGDVYITIRISSAGFSGHNDLWVREDDFESFCAGLTRLEKERNGEACLIGIDPLELSIKIRSIDSKGHMIVEGHTGYAIQRQVTRPFHSVSFGIEFDPTQLSAVKNFVSLYETQTRSPE